MLRNQDFNSRKPFLDEADHNESHRLKQTAQYISDMLLELRHISKCSGFSTLQGLLEISYYEAFNAANKIDVPEGEAEFLHRLGADARKSLVA